MLALLGQSGEIEVSSFVGTHEYPHNGLSFQVLKFPQNLGTKSLHSAT